MTDESEFAEACTRWSEALDGGIDLSPALLLPDRPDLQPRLAEACVAMRKLRDLLQPSAPDDELESRERRAWLRLLGPPRDAGSLGTVGKYSIRGVLGSGGMGIVFEAYDSALERTLAIKFLQDNSEPDRERFQREGRALARVHHDNILPVYDHDYHAGQPFLAMALLPGETLHVRLRREPQSSVAFIEQVGRECAAGLEAIHGNRIIHRDIKPSNLWLETFGDGVRVRIMDFGLARIVQPGEPRLSTAGALVGTPGWHAPEQASDGIDARADLFSLGCVLYRMATGRDAFLGKTRLDLVHAVDHALPPPPNEFRTDLPPLLALLIGQLLAKDKDDRPSGAAEVLERLTHNPIPANVMKTLPRIAFQYPRPGVRTFAPEAGPRTPPRRPAPTRQKSRRASIALGTAIAAAFTLLLLAGITRWKTDVGTIVIDTDVPGAAVAIDGNSATVTINNEVFTIRAGKHTFLIAAVGYKSESVAVEVNRGERTVLKVHLEAVPVVPAAISNRGAAPKAPARAPATEAEVKECKRLVGLLGGTCTDRADGLEVRFETVTPETKLSFLDRTPAISLLDIVASTAPNEVHRLIGTLPRLKILRLDHMSHPTAAAKNATLPAGLLELHFIGPDIDADDLKHFDSVRTLTVVSIHNANLSDPELGKCIPNASGLVELNLSYCTADDRLVAALPEMPKLRGLDLTQTNIGDEGVRSLSRFKALEVIRVNKSTSKTVIDELKKSLPKASIGVSGE